MKKRFYRSKQKEEDENQNQEDKSEDMLDSNELVSCSTTSELAPSP
jgi:hypothetical protein